MVLLILTLAVFAAPALASSPTYGASAAAMAIDPITENYDCGSVTINGSTVSSLVPPDRCYSGEMTASGYRKKGNGAPYGDAQPVAGTWVGLVIPAPESNSPTQGDYILWIGTAGAFSQYAGPGSRLSGDNFVIYHSPNSHQGRRGQGGTLTLMNDEARPQDGGFWIAGGFIHDTDLGKWVIPTVVTYPTGNQNTLTDVTFKVGESSNGYSGYAWTDIVTFKFNPPLRTSNDYGIRWHYQGNQFVKDANDPDLWIGVVPWTNLEGSGPLRGSAPALLDFSEANNPSIGIQLCLGFQNLDTSLSHVRAGFNGSYDFYCYREAEAGTPVSTRPINPTTGIEALPAGMVGDFVRNVAKVTTSHGTHGEIWMSSYNKPQKWCSANWSTGYASEDACALARNACGIFLTDNDLYLDNRDNLLSGKTEQPQYFEWSLSTLWKVGSAKYLDNDLVQWPSPQGDHGNTYLNVNRYDWGEKLASGAHKEALYVGVKRSHCLEPWNWGNQRWNGVGTAFLNLLEK